MWLGATGALSQNEVKCLYGLGGSYMNFVASPFAEASMLGSGWGRLGIAVKVKLLGRQRVVF